jgi:hypothetical protein
MFDPVYPQLQTAFDNSSLALFKDCPRKYYYAIIEGWRPSRPSIVLDFGTAMHSSLECFDIAIADGKSHDEALALAVRHALKLSHKWSFEDNIRNPYTLLRAIIWYADQYKNDPIETVKLPNGKPALELSFRFELDIKTPSGEPYLYCGHIDKIGKFNGAIYAIDRKTTTSALTDTYFARYNPNGQISGYSVAAQILRSEPSHGFIIDAIQLGVNFCRSQRYIVTRTQEQLEEWLHNTIEWIKRIEAAAVTKSWPMNEESCTKYGSCQFREVCSKTPSIRDNWLATYFVRDRWNPLVSR